MNIRIMSVLIFSLCCYPLFAQEEVPAWARDSEQSEEMVKTESGLTEGDGTHQNKKPPPPADSSTHQIEGIPAWAKEPQDTRTPTPIDQISTPMVSPMLRDSGSRIDKGEKDEEAPMQAPQTQEVLQEVPKDDVEMSSKKSVEKKDEGRGDTSGLIYEGRSSIGAASIVGSKSNIGIKGGYLRLPEVPYEVHYLHVEPRIELLWTKFALSIQGPLNFKIYDVQSGTDEMWKLRDKDWDEPSDFTKIIRFIKYGRKDDRLYINVTTLSSSTLGHGTIMRRYVPNVDIDHKKLGLQFDVNHNYLGFQSTISDFFGPPVFGIMPFVRPLAPFSNNLLASSLSIGLTFAADTDAPVTLKRINLPNYKFSFPNGKPYINRHNRLEYDSTFLYLWGIDAHIKVVRTKKVDIKPYIDWSTLKDGGWGFTGGILSRFAFGEKTRSFITLRTDYRTFQPNYEPTYFNTFYEFQKYQYFMPSFSDYDYRKGYYPTKREEILSRRGDMRHGYYLEFQYELSKYFSIGSSIENSTGVTYSVLGKDGSQNPIKAGNGNFLLYLSLPLPYFLSAHFTYHKIAYTDIGNIVDFYESNTILLATIKFRPINLIGVYATLQESWQLDNWTGLYVIVPQVSLGVDLAYYF
ncbi:MAG: hypothetical protein N2746_06165 [Deltaproteobacteria bacterium]|nr:hypothetical protein [Deltaproteobacteria bacterium]